jgi:rRNA maturation RNase YbeY
MMRMKRYRGCIKVNWSKSADVSSIPISKKLRITLDKLLEEDFFSEGERFKFFNTQISIECNLVSDLEIKKLNKLHRKKNSVTDVLSFPFWNSLKTKKQKKLFLKELLVMGDKASVPVGSLVISLPQAKRQAQEWNQTLSNEMLVLFFHGWLHLLGWDHENSEQEAKKMQALEKKLLSKFFDLYRSDKNRIPKSLISRSRLTK